MLKMKKFLDNTVRIFYNLIKYGTKNGTETARFVKHKLYFRLFKWRLYKVESERRAFGNTSQPLKKYFIISDTALPSYKYKVFMISGNMQRLNDYLFVWRSKK